MGDVLSRFEPPAGRVGAPAEGEVHVWRVGLDPPGEVVAELRGLLAADEVARAERFHFEQHRRRYTVGRGALRRLLGGYLGIPPDAVRFAYGEREKPRLAEQGAGLPLQFNLSNSSELALVAVTVGPEVGVDLEAVRPMVYVTTMLLLLVVIVMSFTAIVLRNYMRKKYSTGSF